MPITKCDRSTCLKEINSKQFPGIYFGKPFVYDPDWMACYLCTQNQNTHPKKLIKRVQDIHPIDHPLSIDENKNEDDKGEGYKALFHLLIGGQE